MVKLCFSDEEQNAESFGLIKVHFTFTILKGNKNRIVNEKEPMKLIENGSSIFTCYVKTIPIYDFELVCVVLHPFVKEFFKTMY